MAETRVKAQQAWIRAFAVLAAVAITLIPLAWAVNLPLALGAEIFDEQALTVMLGLAFAVIFLNVPGRRDRSKPGVAWYDIALGLAGFTVCVYLAVRYQVLVENFYELRPEGFAISIVIIPLVLEALRRTVGWNLVIILALFLAYGLLGHLVPPPMQGQEKKFVELVAYLGIDNVALMGRAMNIVCMIVVMFIFLGSLLVASGASGWFTELAAAMLGRSRGGSAKIAVMASGLFGSISGSAVSNVVSTGVITIPLMRRAGYDARTAGAIEAVASTGGQIMPPIMGAAAFLIAEFLEVAYRDVILAALMPAILYYLSIFIQTDLEAAKKNIAPVPKDQIPPFFKVIKEGWFFAIPFIVLIVALFRFNVPPAGAAFYAAVSIPIVSLLFGYKGQRITAEEIWRCLVSTGRTSVDIIAIGAMAGLIIGVIETTGLGFALTLVLVTIGENNLWLLLTLTAVVCIILGMGLPTTAIYVLLALVVAPPLVKLGLEPMAVHLFVLYFGLMSMITPPVAIAAFAAAKLAEAGPIETALVSVRLGWVAYVIPFVFVLSPSLIMKGSVLSIVLAFVSAVIGVWIASAGLMGYLARPIGPLLRLLYFGVGLLLLVPVELFTFGIALKTVTIVVAAAMIAGEFLRNPKRKSDPLIAAASKVPSTEK